MKRKLSTILLLLTLLSVVLLTACSDGLPWSDSSLAKMIPIPVSSRREVVVDEEDAFSVDIYNMTSKSFGNYITYCDAVGFRRGAERTDETYSAYHANGAHMELSFVPEEGRMRIDVVSMTSRGFAEKVFGDVNARLDALESDIGMVENEIDALPVYKMAGAGGITSTMATADLRTFIYRLHPTIASFEALLAACKDKKAAIKVESLDADLVAVYEALDERIESVAGDLLALTGDAYGLENALESMHRQKTVAVDFTTIEQGLVTIATELSRLTKALESPSFEIRAAEEGGVTVYKLDESAFYEALCDALPGLTDLGVDLEKYEDALFLLVEQAVDNATVRGQYATLESQLLKIRRSHYLSLDAAREQEAVLTRYRAGEELFPVEESLAVLPSFPTLETPLATLDTQIEAVRADIAELEATSAVGMPVSQPLIERAYTTLAKLQLSLTECTEAAIKMRRAGTCYPNTSPSSQPVFDGMEDRIVEYRRALGEMMTELEQLEHSRNDMILSEIESVVTGIEQTLEEYGKYLLDVMAVLSNPEQLKSQEDVERVVSEIGSRIEHVGNMQKELGDRLNAVIEVKTGSLKENEVARAIAIENKIYELNDTTGRYAETLKLQQNAVEEIRVAKARSWGIWG